MYVHDRAPRNCIFAGIILAFLHPLVTWAASPEVRIPRDGDILPMTPAGQDNPPYELVFDPIAGAYVYRLTLVGPVTEELHFLDCLAGEVGVISLNLDSAIPSGSYEMVLEAFDDTGAPVGDPSQPIQVDFVAQVPTTFAPTQDVILSGNLLVSSAAIPAGVTVTANADLALYSLGPVTVAGAVRGLDALGPGMDGVSVRILAASNIEVMGEVRGGHGAAGDDVVELGTDPAVDTEAKSGGGGRGGAVVLLTSGDDIVVHGTATVASGDGGPAGEARAEGADGTQPGEAGGHAVASGGAGGIGGALTLYSPVGVLDVAQVAGVLALGAGGVGGHVTAIGGRGADSLPGGLPGLGGATETYGGRGGDSGYLALSSLDWDGDGEISSAELDVIDGGAGASAGASSNLPGSHGMSIPLLRRPGWLGLPFKACTNGPPAPTPREVRDMPLGGGSSPFGPAPGQDARAVGQPGVGSGRGGNALAFGGLGGGAQMLTCAACFCSDPSECDHPIYLGLPIAVGQTGGAAQAYGGNGGPLGGSGGRGHAFGGRGGDSFIPGESHQVFGGTGGAAYAKGGTGMKSLPCCDPPVAGLQGGQGGTAWATGGIGGSSHFFGGVGGDAEADPGRGGDGGDGCPAGPGGPAGDALAMPGTGGAGAVMGLPGSAMPRPGQAGLPGNPCPKQEQEPKKAD